MANLARKLENWDFNPEIHAHPSCQVPVKRVLSRSYHYVTSSLKLLLTNVSSPSPFIFFLNSFPFSKSVLWALCQMDARNKSNALNTRNIRHARITLLSWHFVVFPEVHEKLFKLIVICLISTVPCTLHLRMLASLYWILVSDLTDYVGYLHLELLTRELMGRNNASSLLNGVINGADNWLPRAHLLSLCTRSIFASIEFQHLSICGHILTEAPFSVSPSLYLISGASLQSTVALGLDLNWQ